MQGLVEALGLQPGVMLVNLTGFIILMVLLKKYAFGPVGDTLADRERSVDADLNEAERAKQRALADEKNMEDELEKLRRRRSEIISKAEKQAGERRQEILEQAREESQEILAEGRHGVERASEQARRELRDETADIAVSVSERVLREALDEERQAALVDAFIEDVERMAAGETEGSESS